MMILRWRRLSIMRILPCNASPPKRSLLAELSTSIKSSKGYQAGFHLIGPEKRGYWKNHVIWRSPHSWIWTFSADLWLPEGLHQGEKLSLLGFRNILFIFYFIFNTIQKLRTWWTICLWTCIIWTIWMIGYWFSKYFVSIVCWVSLGGGGGGWWVTTASVVWIGLDPFDGLMTCSPWLRLELGLGHSGLIKHLSYPHAIRAELGLGQYMAQSGLSCTVVPVPLLIDVPSYSLPFWKKAYGMMWEICSTHLIVSHVVLCIHAYSPCFPNRVLLHTCWLPKQLFQWNCKCSAKYLYCNFMWLDIGIQLWYVAKFCEDQNVVQNLHFCRYYSLWIIHNKSSLLSLSLSSLKPYPINVDQEYVYSWTWTWRMTLKFNISI